jgi:flagellar biosynthesis regulator FlbT
MEKAEVNARMWSDLLSAELRVVAEKHAVTQRALIFISAGLPVERVYDALKISRATWQRRVVALKDWQAGNREASSILERGQK